MNKAKNIVITGFMGTGKSTIGPIVAEKLGRLFIETDKEIEMQAGKSIPKIFAEDGESAFRLMEREMCRYLSNQQNLVISTGGGMLVDDENLRLMRESGLVICLTATHDVLEQRLADSAGRPLAQSWWEVLERRRAAYEAIPHHIDTSTKSPEQVAAEMIALWRSSHYIQVQTPEGAYPIVIESGLIDILPQRAEEFGLDGHVVIVTNETIAPLYGEKVRAALPNASLISLPDGEEYKTWPVAAALFSDLVRAKADRSTTLLALGGGVVGDIVGFAAAAYMRGIRFVQMPTTLLAMVDSSVGGKVGIDLPEGKNLVGAFKQPEAVLIDPGVLSTLPPVQWRCGMAEVVKHGLLADENLLDSTMHQPENAAELIRRAVQVKVDVVQQDPFEHGIRAHLNLGHTFGHAIEQVSGYQWLHGEAVSVGLVAALRLSHVLGLCDLALVQRTEKILESIGLPRTLSGMNPEEVYAAMSSDKKWKQGRSRFVLLRAIGDPCIVEGIDKAEIIKVLQSLSPV